MFGNRSSLYPSEGVKIDPAAMAFDVDGVCADTMGLFLEILRNDFGIDGFSHRDISCYSLEKCLDVDPDVIRTAICKILDGDYHYELRPIDGAREVLSRVAERSGKLLFVTARPNTGPVERWFRDLLKIDSGIVEIVATGSFEAKTDVLLNKKVSYFVEDRLDTCFSIFDQGVTPLLMVQPWNREKHPFVEVGSWRELGELIDF